MSVTVETPLPRPPAAPARPLQLVRTWVVRVEPPADDEIDDPLALVGWPPAPGQELLELAWAPDVPPLHPVPAYDGPDEEEDGDAAFEPRRTPRDELPAPGPRAVVLVRALLEAFAGDRPAGQLMRWTTPELFVRLEQMVRPTSHRPWAGTLRRVRVCEPAPGIAEVAAVVEAGARTSALALRLEGYDGRWLMTELDLV